MPFCNKCGAQLSKEASFCPKCGEKMIAESDDAQQTPSNRYCPSCGAKIIASNRFCDECGSELKSLLSGTKDSSSNLLKRGFFLFIGIIIVTILGTYIWRTATKNNTSISLGNKQTQTIANEKEEATNNENRLTKQFSEPYYVVIAGSAQNRREAESLLNLFAAKGFSGEIFKSDTFPGLERGWYIVKAGVFADEQEARKLVANIKSTGLHAYYRRGDLARFIDGTAIASSELEPQSGKYKAQYAIDGNKSTAWCWSAERATLTIEFPTDRLITRIDILPGYDKTHPTYGDVYFLNNRVKRLRLENENSISEIITLSDEKSFQSITLHPVSRRDYIDLVIEEVYPGSRWDDTGISEIRIWGQY